ncbi:MAG: alpha-amylase family glycosyl hydrolase, partial [Anaerolineales bacterium]
MRSLSLLVVFTLLAGLFPTGVVQASVPQAPALAAPATVTLVGDLQTELGCASDWDPTCAATQLTFDSEDQVWQGTFTVPAGNWLYKVATDGNWSNPYPPGFTNLNLNLAAGSSVKFYFSDSTPWLADSVSNVIATAVGDFQSELGCSADWSPSCLRSWMQDPNNDNIYTFSTTSIPAGSYEAKVALNESWAVSYPGSNLNFTVPNTGDTVTFTYNAATNAVNISVTGSGASLDNNIWWSHLGHNSRDPLYRNPGGAVPTGTPVTLRLRAASGDLELARVRVWNDRTDTSTLYNMTKVASNMALPGDPGPYEFWEVTLPASADPTVYWYRFIVKDGTATAYYEDDNARTGGWGQPFATSPDNSYQLSIYDPAFTTPDWVKNAVVYQIFPDRFRDGDSSNNPQAGEFFYGANDTITRSNATDWNTPICDPRNRPGAVSGCVNKYSQNFYGGDLQGIIDELDYLDALGITAIYLNPIFKSPSNHKYDTADYGQIDPHFGTLADFQQLVNEANQRDIYIILDGVFNHVSSDSPYMDRYGRYPEVGACESPTSPYRDWFYFTDVTPGTGVCASSTGVPNA